MREEAAVASFVAVDSQLRSMCCDDGWVYAVRQRWLTGCAWVGFDPDCLAAVAIAAMGRRIIFGVMVLGIFEMVHQI